GVLRAIGRRIDARHEAQIVEPGGLAEGVTRRAEIRDGVTSLRLRAKNDDRQGSEQYTHRRAEFADFHVLSLSRKPDRYSQRSAVHCIPSLQSAQKAGQIDSGAVENTS